LPCERAKWRRGQFIILSAVILAIAVISSVLVVMSSFINVERIKMRAPREVVDNAYNDLPRALRRALAQATANATARGVEDLGSDAIAQANATQVVESWALSFGRTHAARVSEVAIELLSLGSNWADNTSAYYSYLRCRVSISADESTYHVDLAVGVRVQNVTVVNVTSSAESLLLLESPCTLEEGLHLVPEPSSVEVSYGATRIRGSELLGLAVSEGKLFVVYRLEDLVREDLVNVTVSFNGIYVRALNITVTTATFYSGP